MTSTAYIVYHRTPLFGMSSHWCAHRRGFWSTLNRFNTFNVMSGTITHQGADKCEEFARIVLSPEIKPEIIRVIRVDRKETQ